MRIVITDTAPPALKTKAERIARSQRRMEAIGDRVAEVLREHFQTKNNAGNKKGWWRSNFWVDVVKSATSRTGATDRTATVTVASREFVHKLKDGVVRAKGGSFLAIPLRSEAKEKGSPGEWSQKGDGQLIPIRTGRGLFLFRNLGFRGRGRTKGQRLEVWYKLVTSVRHLADPTALPPRQQILDAINDQLQREIAAELQ